MRMPYQPPERPKEFQDQDAQKCEEEYRLSVRTVWFVGAIIMLLMAFRNCFLN